MVLFGGLADGTVNQLALAEIAYVIAWLFPQGKRFIRSIYFRVPANVMGFILLFYLIFVLIAQSFQREGFTLEARATTPSSAHTVIWLIMALAILVISIVPDIDITRGLIIVAGLNGWHENYWYAAYFIHNPSFILTNLQYYSPFIMLEFSFQFLMILKYYPIVKAVLEEWLWLWILYLVFWLWEGFSITIDLQYGVLDKMYGIPSVDFIEVFSWALFIATAVKTYLYMVHNKKILESKTSAEVLRKAQRDKKGVTNPLNNNRTEG